MQDKYSELDYSDNDRTDELPVLTEESIIARGSHVAAFDDILDDEDTGKHRVDFSAEQQSPELPSSHEDVAIAVLQQELLTTQRDLAEQRLANEALGSTIEQLEAQLADVQDDFSRQQLQIGELRAALKHYQQRYGVLQDQLTAATAAVEKQKRLVEESAAAPDSTQPYRDEIQALTAYITGRRERWQEMEILVASQGERIADLQRELSQRIDRERAAEQAMHQESTRANELKDKLTEVIATLRVRERDLALLKRARTGERSRSAASDASAEVAQLSSELDERDRQLTVANEERDGLERRLLEVETNLTRTRGDFGRLEKSLVEKDRAVDRQDERVADLQHELSERLAALHRSQSKTTDSDTPGATNHFPVLVCLTSDKPERHVIAEAETVIGRGAGCAIRILTQFVSREHARLKRHGGEVTIEDCGSTNGVFVNSLRVERHRLEHGDWVTIGETQFRFLSAGAA
jgi:chromosome segregation ATPase